MTWDFYASLWGQTEGLAAVYLLYNYSLYTIISFILYPNYSKIYILIIHHYIPMIYPLHISLYNINPLQIHLSHVISFYIPFISHLYHSYLAAVWTWLSQVVAALLANSWEPGCGWWMRKSSIRWNVHTYNVYIYICNLILSHIHIYIYTYIYTHIYTYIYICLDEY